MSKRKPAIYSRAEAAKLGVWPFCGHPKTPENTQHVGCAGERCRACRQDITYRWFVLNRKVGAA